MLQYLSLRRWRSGQSQQTVNLSALCLRWFESNPAHNEKSPNGDFFVRQVGFERRRGPGNLLVPRGGSTWNRGFHERTEHHFFDIKKVVLGSSSIPTRRTKVIFKRVVKAASFCYTNTIINVGRRSRPTLTI